VLTNVGSLVLRVYLLKCLWTALYTQNAAPINLPLHGMITYATVALLMSLILEVDGTRMIREKIREGTIATDLMKPISVPLYFFSDGVGQTLLHVVLVVPSLLCALLLVRIDVPSAATFGAFLLAFAIGYGVNFFLNFLMNSIAFWTLETFAAQLIVRWASDLLSGQIIPLTLFPGIIGYDETVIPQIVNAVLSGHDVLFLGLRGQGKTRMLRMLTELLDDAARWAGRDHLVQGSRRVTFGAMTQAADRVAAGAASAPRLTGPVLQFRLRILNDLGTKVAGGTPYSLRDTVGRDRVKPRAGRGW